MANLKGSVFYNWSNKSYNFSLSEYTSEWLHFCGFWDGINDRFDTLFQQFESDTLPLNLMENIIFEITQLITVISHENNTSFYFRCRWDPEGNEIYIKIQKTHILNELKKLSDFIQQSHDQNLELECDL